MSTDGHQQRVKHTKYDKKKQKKHLELFHFAYFFSNFLTVIKKLFDSKYLLIFKLWQDFTQKYVAYVLIA